MTIKRHFFTRSACFLSTVLLIAGCGGGGDSAPADPGGNNPPLGRDDGTGLTISGTPQATVASGTAYSFLPTAQDPQSDPLTFSITNQPAWATFDPATGLLSGTPTADQIGTTSGIVISVSDGTSTKSLPAFDLQVTEPSANSSAPVITSTALTTAVEGMPFSYQVVATDADPGSAFTYSLTAAPIGMAIDTSGLITWTPTADGVGSHTVTTKVADNGSPAKETEQTFTLNVTALVPPSNPNAPVIQSIAPKHAQQGTTFTYQVQAVDANGDAITYSLETAPVGMTIDPATGAVSWPVPAAGNGTQIARIAVSDPSGLKTTQTLSLPIVLPRTGWVATASSAESVSETSPAANVLDGNTATIWHSTYSTAVPLPQEIQIDLGTSHNVSGFLYLPRQDGGTGNIKQYQFYVSESTADWGTPVATGIFADNNAKEKIGRIDAPLTFKAGRYVKLVVLSEQTAQPYTAIAELNLQGNKNTNRAPQVTIDAPTSAITTIKAGDTLDFSATTSDPEGGVLTYAWSFGDPAIRGKRTEDSGPIVFPTAGAYSVKLTATDDQGQATSATRIVRVLDATETLIPRVAWTAVADSEEKVAEDGSAKNAFDDNPQTIWHTQWFDAAPANPHSITINLGGNYSVSAIRHLPRQDGPSGRIAGYEVYVSADGATWTNVGSGTFANNATETKVAFAAVDARHVRLVSTSEVGGRPFASAAEINVTGTPR